MNSIKTIRTAVLACCMATSAAAQGSWDSRATFYLFGAETTTGITTPAGSVETELSFGDALDNLDFAFMGAFETHNGRWGGFVDFMYYDLSFGSTTPGPAFSGANTSLEMNIVTIAGLYRVFEDEKTKVDIAAGLRWYDVDSTIELLPGLAAGRSFAASRDWTDPIIGVRARHAFDERWSGTVYLDYGGFSSDSETWQFLLVANYAINDMWELHGGYRYISFDNTEGGVNLYVSQSGPVFGATVRF